MYRYNARYEFYATNDAPAARDVQEQTKSNVHAMPEEARKLGRLRIVLQRHQNVHRAHEHRRTYSAQRLITVRG